MHMRTARNVTTGIPLLAALLILAAGSFTTMQARPGGTDQTAEKNDAAKAAAASTTEKDRVDLAVTVYNSNLALVRDVRQIHLPAGEFPLKFEDVAATINPATVHFRSLTDAAKLNVIEQIGRAHV